MDIDQDLTKKKCYKFEEQIIDNVVILYNKFNNLVVFWNKYQIILYEDSNFEKAAKMIIPEYHIQSLILSNNYLVSLDYSYNLHLISLKFKKVTQRCFESTFQPRETCIKAIAQMSTDFIVILKREESTYFLNVHRLNQDFSLEKRTIVICKEQIAINSQQENIIMHCHTIKEDNLKQLQKVFNIDENSETGSSSIIAITFDRKVLYACLLDLNVACEEISLVKLYSCPSEMCNIEIMDTNVFQIFIGLTIGSIIKLSLTEKCKKPDVIHLNTALSKFMIYNNNLLYTDSQTMWKAENIHSEIKFKQLFMRNVKDFIYSEDWIICTTFSKLIYKFAIHNEDSFLKLESEEYCPAENILNNSDYWQKIMEHVEKNEQLVKRLGEEETYLTALALSNRQNLMDEIIQSKVVVYESYLDVIKENTELKLTENISNYFAKDIILFLINVTLSTIQHKLNKVVQSIFDNSRILITLSSDDKTLKSASIKMNRQNHNLKCLMPLEDSFTEFNQIYVNIIIVIDIPGIFDEKTNVVTVLYRKNIRFNSEQLIKKE